MAKGTSLKLKNITEGLITSAKSKLFNNHKVMCNSETQAPAERQTPPSASQCHVSLKPVAAVPATTVQPTKAFQTCALTTTDSPQLLRCDVTPSPLHNDVKASAFTRNFTLNFELWSFLGPYARLS